MPTPRDTSEGVGGTRMRAAASRLLQNMSCRPDASVQHEGKHDGRALRFAFAFPAGRPPRLTDVMALLPSPRVRGLSLIENLDRFARQHCGRLACLPAVAAVHATAAGDAVPGLTDDPFLVLAVLTRCNGAVFMRDRSPAVSETRVLRSITLLTPRTWSLPS